LDGEAVGNGRVAWAVDDEGFAAVVGSAVAVVGAAVSVGVGGVHAGDTAPNRLPEAKGIINPTTRANARVTTVSTIFEERCSRRM
jgi:hypothetical protein